MPKATHSRSVSCLRPAPALWATTQDTEEPSLDSLLLNNCPLFFLCVACLLQPLLSILSESPVQWGRLKARRGEGDTQGGTSGLTILL